MTRRTAAEIGYASRTRPSRCRAAHYLDPASPTKARRSKCRRSPLVLFKNELADLPGGIRGPLARAFLDKTICDHCQTADRMQREAKRRKVRRATAATRRPARRRR